MHILLCNERFLFRFGVDRVMLVLARLLREKGHHVTLMGIAMDRQVALSVADRVVEIPSGDDYYNINEFVQCWLERNWDNIFRDDPPDLIVNCGWPFFTCMPFFAKRVKHVIFHDYGIVPIYNYTDGTLKIQNKVRELRKRFMRFSSYVITISDYITKTTYEILPQYGIPVKTIHLGADHMESGLWNSRQLENGSKLDRVSWLVKRLQNQGRKIILNLGRWETGHYKKSEAMYEFLRGLKANGQKCAMLILGSADKVYIPEDLKDLMFPLGFIDDDQLVQCMRISDLGVSSSLWEGHNLPMPEMQYYERPVLAFNVGAHPEVVLHPWYLCSSVKEMVRKAQSVFAGQDLAPEIKSMAYKRFKKYFTWKRCAESIYEVFEKVVSNDRNGVSFDVDFKENNLKSVTLVMDMTNPARDPANPGIIRTCRQLAARLQYYVNPIFVIRSDGDEEFVLPTRDEYKTMGTFSGPLLMDEELLSPDNHRITLDDYFTKHMRPDNLWLLLPDIVDMEKGLSIQAYCKRWNINIVDIFYDDIPYKLYEMYGKGGKDCHARYMMRLSDSDLVLSISQYSSDCLLEFFRELGLYTHNIRTAEIAGEFLFAPRKAYESDVTKKTVQFAMVSTLEPRKNHRQVIDACLMLERKIPDLDYKFIMIGNKFAGHFGIADYVREACEAHPRLEWRGVVSDEEMDTIIRDSSFTVYASSMEGYGLPIMESLWRGKPCLCSNQGAMAELATGGGCFTVDINDPSAICDGLYELCTNSDLLRKLKKEATSRKIKTWDEYAEEVLTEIAKRQTTLVGRILPDRRYGKECAPPNRLEWDVPSEICRYLSLSESGRNRVGIALGPHSIETLIYLADNYDLVFALDCSTSPPRINIVSINECAEEVIKEISLSLADHNVTVDALFVDSSVYLGHKAQTVREALGNEPRIVSYNSI